MNEKSMRLEPDRRNPFDENPDDRLCYCCGSPLPENPTPGSFQYMGFCDRRCYEEQGRIADSWIAEDEVSDEFDERKYEEVRKELEEKRPRGIFDNSLASLLRCEIRNPVFVEVENEEDLEFEDPVDREIFVDVKITKEEASK